LTLDGPVFSADLPWFRGNLHSHTTESDGRESPAEVMAHYRRQGYDFLCLSDHDMLTRADPAEVPDGLTILPGFEAGVGPHILCVGVNELIPKMSDRQAVIDRTNAQGGFAVLNHPNWGRSFSHWDQEMLESLQGYAGIEIYNGVIEVLEGSPYALDRWDRLLTAGKRVWGFAHDDSHSREGIGLGWLMVQAETCTPDSLLPAMTAGGFYNSTGVTLDRIERDGDTWLIESGNADRIKFVSQWGRVIGLADRDTGTFLYRSGGEAVHELLQRRENGLSVRYPFQGDEGFVRCEALGRGGRAAWTQPTWVEP
jgi:hypothetical protein